MKKKTKNTEEITRNQALNKIGNYGKYAALTAVGTYLILSPQKAQSQSPVVPIDSPGGGFD